MHYSVFTAPIAMVLKKYMKSNSHIRRFFGSMARECILYKIFIEKKQIQTTVYEVSDPQKPVEEQTYEQGSLVGTRPVGRISVGCD